VPVDLLCGPSRIAAVLDHPHELTAYQRWLDERRSARRGAPRDYLFSEDRPRFEPRKDDVVVAVPHLRAKPRGGGCRLVGRGIDLPVDGVSVEQASRLLEAMDGKRCLLEVRWTAKVDAEAMGRFLRATFGRVVLAPQAVAALEARLSGAELVRFPTAPYAIERPYWENMIAVRERAVGPVPAHEDFARWLRTLHVVALMGPALDRFYMPASPIADRVVAPGAFFVDGTRLLETRAGTIYLDGPRVKVPLLGGEGYHRALAASVDDDEALAPTRHFISSSGLGEGRIVTARSERDDQPVPMFLPPRPLTPDHLEALRDALEATRESRADAVVRACARFHRLFVRLHPFHCANQSLAMNLVNAALGDRLGAGIPHLLLDHLALRFGDEAYEELFRRAVTSFCLPPGDGPAARLMALQDRKARSFAVVEALGAGTPLEELRDRDREALGWALVAAPDASGD